MKLRSAIAGAAFALLAACGEPEQDVRARLTLAQALAAPVEGYATATERRPFSFPEDHGPHPSFATEWWYFTGNVADADGRRFGYELTFFRKALTPEPVERTSSFAADQAYMAHFAVTDVAGDAFHAFDRFGRAAAGLAGARAEPFRVWLYDWSVESSGDAAFPARLRAAAGDIGIDLIVRSGKPPVLQGERGLSRKSPVTGNASFYYSLTRMPTRGTITTGDGVFTVEGSSWMDREWSTSVLDDDLDGWDWFALHLSDGTELMLYQLRHGDGRASAFSAGSAVAADGTNRILAADDFTVDVLDHWRSPRDDTAYPARWRVRVPSERLDLVVTPLLADQELNLTVRYWEGAVEVRGTRGEEQVTGDGYVELTGYADSSGEVASGSGLRAGS